MKASVTAFVLQVALAAGSGLASAATMDLDFPDAEENGFEEVEAPAAPAPKQHLVAAPVVVRLIPMTPAAAPAPAPAPMDPGDIDAEDGSD
jgi:hypothetical protein